MFNPGDIVIGSYSGVIIEVIEIGHVGNTFKGKTLNNNHGVYKEGKISNGWSTKSFTLYKHQVLTRI